MTSRPSTAAPILAAIAIVLLPLGAYVGGYYLSGKYHVGFHGPNAATPMTIRCYKYSWQILLFEAVGQFEEWLFGRDVWVREMDEK